MLIFFNSFWPIADTDTEYISFCLKTVVFSDKCSGNFNILLEDLTFVDGLKQNSCI